MQTTRTAAILAFASMLASAASAQDWVPDEAPLLTQHTQLTFPEQFAKAGEAYFSPDMRWIIFQAMPTPSDGEQVDPHYSMYAAPLRIDGDAITGLGEPVLLSPPGSANTCGWFHPTEQGVVLFGSTLIPPSDDNVPGYQRDTSRYAWAFPSEMTIVQSRIGSNLPPKPIFTQPGYSAEGSWSPDGRFILYANIDEAKSERLQRGDADLWIYDHQTKERTRIIEADGYDGGPFFSPDARWICYRSDRKGNNELQLFAAELDYADDGRVVGIRREIALTDNKDVNWAPYWHPTSEFWAFTSSAFGHFNYEVVGIEFDPEKSHDQLATFRITNAAGFDGLSVFSPDGRWMMWTSQRGEGGSSQLWIARFNTAIARGHLLPAVPAAPFPGVEADGN